MAPEKTAIPLVLILCLAVASHQRVAVFHIEGLEEHQNCPSKELLKHSAKCNIKWSEAIKHF